MGYMSVSRQLALTICLFEDAWLRIGGVYIFLKVPVGPFLANYCGLAYSKQLCQMSWVNLMKKRPSISKIKYLSATF